MILNIHSDAWYLSEREAKSRAGGFFYMGSNTDKANKLTNGAIIVISTFLKHLMSSAAEEEIGAVFLNSKEGTVLRTTPEEVGHHQPLTPLQTNTTTSTGYSNGTTTKTHTGHGYGYALLLGQRQGQKRTISCLLGPTIPKIGGLFYETPFASASLKNVRNIHSRE
jgi:hypothetical protein